VLLADPFPVAIEDRLVLATGQVLDRELDAAGNSSATASPGIIAFEELPGQFGR
jgi:hypothetical protein